MTQYISFQVRFRAFFLWLAVIAILLLVILFMQNTIIELRKENYLLASRMNEKVRHAFITDDHGKVICFLDLFKTN